MSEHRIFAATSVFFAVAVAVAVACLFTTGCAPSYIVGSPLFSHDRVSAEAADIAAVNEAYQSQPVEGYDAPIKLIRAPQPKFPSADRKRNQVDVVEVDIHFSELGFVERTVVVRSTFDSLVKPVIAATSQWQIEPAKRDGQSARLVVRRTYVFDSRK